MKALNKQEHQTENDRMSQSLAERNGEPVEGLRQRISELEEIATDYGMKFQKAQDALKHQSLLHKSQMEAAEKRIAELQSEKPRLSPHKYRECVNTILEHAIAYSGCQQLREQLSSALELFVEPDHPHTRAAGIGVKGE